ncbi:hypothetical protein Glo7428_4083 [Gloeocapsa sp. PCC 7428]|uniref:hypothetical protein n=1 Tax=Gloeocapsa sp. PCC 7428 TaxID=1173026 RepID=UPI0002A5C745|nr:hypothetical protein [Gloeocapsa sp. PCC 7428]AFZ32533.1 hypothetical protein Glo7428_4083 [Gloeocapsa sp. PCC 7428]
MLKSTLEHHLFFRESADIPDTEAINNLIDVVAAVNAVEIEDEEERILYRCR